MEENKKLKLKDLLLNLDTSDKISLVNDCNSYDGSLDFLRVDSNDEEFFNIYFEGKPYEVARAINYGKYNYMDDYVRFNVYGNLESLNDYDFDSDFESYIDEVIQVIEELGINSNNIDLSYYIDLEELEEETQEEQEEEKKYNTLEEIQKTIEERQNNPQFDYYDNTNVCIIHVKFGRMKKAYYGLETIKDNYFIDNFSKFWNDEESEFLTHWDVLEYVKEHNLPVIFYKNFSDEEISFNDTIKYFINENGKDNIAEYFIKNYSHLINELEEENEQ